MRRRRSCGRSLTWEVDKLSSKYHGEGKMKALDVNDVDE